MYDKITIFLPNIKSNLLGTESGIKLRGVEVLCSKIFKNWNINTRGWQQCIISINFLIICIFYFEKKKPQMTIYNQELCKSISTS